MKIRLLRLAIISILPIILLIAGWIWLTLTFSFSEGDRAGYVQKLSLKGWVCKTWEGEIAMFTIPGAVAEKFYFTVRDEAIAKKINQLSGKRVVLEYKQHKFVPTNCFGDTEYFVYGVREVADAPNASPNVNQGVLTKP